MYKNIVIIGNSGAIGSAFIKEFSDRPETQIIQSFGRSKNLNHAAKIMAQHLSYFLFDDSSNIKAVNDEALNEALEIKGILSKSIDEMELSVRSHNCLQAAGIYTIGELVSKEESEMLKFKNFGRKSLTELTEKLTALELRFGMDISPYIEE